MIEEAFERDPEKSESEAERKVENDLWRGSRGSVFILFFFFYLLPCVWMRPLEMQSCRVDPLVSKCVRFQPPRLFSSYVFSAPSCDPVSGRQWLGVVDLSSHQLDTD